MAMVHPCSAPGCSTLTMGAYCLEHELKAPVTRFAEHHRGSRAARSGHRDENRLPAKRDR